MSNEDETEQGTSKSSKFDRQQEGNSLGAALESSLQAGLQSLSDRLRNVVEGGISGTTTSRKPPQSRPSAGRKQTKQNKRSESVKRKRKKRTYESESEECLIDTRFTNDEFIVISDMFGTSIDDISFGINPKTNELVISKTGTVVGRVDLPWASPEMKKAWFKNGILEVYIKSEDFESVSDSSL
ncbi:gas vesicle protein GvpH [Natrinema sp. SYSU A 869]|uniref:gas vesicle protein GvpH n=1 Tax=Natrinema sp. SYSU A 869 TaxID=2871694 RepID=UPI001CA40C3F|nr:gas vesicle protein GvpH [Natrinema sp. SYSU A 869]